MIGIDFYYADDSFWDELGKNNPFWGVVCWAHILEPDIPDGVRDRLVEYFGEKVQCKINTNIRREDENNADA